MPDTTARIRAKGLDSTGVTEDIANQLFTKKGSHHMAIVEYRVEETHEKADGTRKVDLILTQVEPAVSDDMDDHLREIVRTCYFNRGTGDQPTLNDGSNEPTVDAVLAAGARHRPHPFLPVDASDDHPICDVCGNLETAPVHSTQDTLDDPDDDEDQGSDEEDPYAGPHDFEAGPDDSCICGLAYGDPIHGHDDDEELVEQDWVDSQHGDAPEQPDDGPWEYEAPEGTSITDPFEVPATTP